MEGGAELYGEIEFDSLAIALEAIRARHGGLGGAARTETFVDVGSGSGLPVVGAAAFHPWREAVGIEIALPSNRTQPSRLLTPASSIYPSRE